MVEFKRRRKDNPVNPNQVFPIRESNNDRIIRIRNTIRELYGDRPRMNAEQEARLLWNKADKNKKSKVLTLAGAGFQLAGDLANEKFDGHLYDYPQLKKGVIRLRDKLI